MKGLIQKIYSFTLSQSNNLSELIVRLVITGLLYSHIIGYQQWFNSNGILSFISFPFIVYKIGFISFIGLCSYVFLRPKKTHWLIIGMIICGILNFYIITPFWINYFLLLLFIKIDSTLQLVIWLLGIQEIWAGLNKFNNGYISIVNFFSNPFIEIGIVYVVVWLLILLLPLLEVTMGFGILFHKKFSKYLSIIIHGGAVIMLAGIIHYNPTVWLWNILIVGIILLLYKNSIRISFPISRIHITIIILLALSPLLQLVTTLSYPLSYRLYTGNEVDLTIDDTSYVYDYYKMTRAIPLLSKETFELELIKKCGKGQFKHAEIMIPKYIFRKESVLYFKCENNTLIQK